MLEKLWGLQISRRALARCLAVLFVLSLIPLIAVALYNYPADDDFHFTLPIAETWVKTGSVLQTLQTWWQSVVEHYNEWQGNFFSVMLFGLNPLIFNIRLYFLSNWWMLAILCLSAAYLVKSVTKHWLKADAAAFWLLYTPVMILMLQFLPHVAYSLYWYNGNQYTTAVCLLLVTLGLMLRMHTAPGGKRAVWRSVCLSLCCFCLGGSFYGPALGAFVTVLLLTLCAWIGRSEARVPFTLASVLFVVGFAISVLAPGNAIRQERLGESAGVLKTLVTTVLDSFDWAGKWMTPQLLGMLLIIVPALWKPLKESSCRFGHPIAASVILYGLFSASFAPGIYTGYGYETDRYLNALYLYWIVTAVGAVIYWEGALIRRLERKSAEGGSAKHLLSASADLGKRFAALYLALCLLLTAFGGFAFTITNTSSLAAAKVILNGEAKTFHDEMVERQEYVRVTDSDLVNVQPLSVAPYVFKKDRLPWQGNYGCVRYMRRYFELFDGVVPNWPSE